MSQNNMVQTLAVETLIDQASSEVSYLPKTDNLSTIMKVDSPQTKKKILLPIPHFNENPAEMMSLLQTNIKSGSIVNDDFNIDISPYMIEFAESTLSGVKNLSQITGDVLTRLNQFYDTLVAGSFKNHPRTTSKDEFDGTDAMDIAKRILSQVFEVTQATQNSTIMGDSTQSAIRIMISSNIFKALMFPTASSGASPLAFLENGLAKLNITPSNVVYDWILEENLVYVANTNFVKAYTYGSPIVFDTNTDIRKKEDYIQFLFSNISVYMRYNGAMNVQKFKNVSAF